MSRLFEQAQLGELTLGNRLVMAPMTRCRATADHQPTPIMADYYGQRAGAGLIVTEGVSPSPDGLGYARIPGLFNAGHVAGWRPVTQAVHDKGGRIFVQLMHTGRVSQLINMPAGARVLAPSALTLEGEMWTDSQGMQPHSAPAAMDEEEIRRTIAEFADSAALAVQAGFDGVELHGANGYLIDQFLNTASNQRADRWGGSVENRARFAVEVARAVAARIGAARTGIRLSPHGAFNGMRSDAEMDGLYAHLAGELGRLGLVYIHVVDHSSMGAPAVPDAVKESIRGAFGGAIIISGGYDQPRAEADLAAGKGLLVAFGRPFIANPDLPRRLREGLPLAQPDSATFYLPGEKGYTDYPSAN
jgi:N-ethylmaleimide reductase